MKDQTKTSEATQAGLPASGPSWKNRFLTKNNMADALQVSVRTIENMMARGQLPYVRVGGRLVRFLLEDVERKLKEKHQ